MLKELIDKFYLDRQKDREQHHFYITDAGRCPRTIFFKFKNVPREEMEARVLRMFDHGDYIHQLIMKPLLSMRDVHVVASEINIPPQEIISGRADAIISDGKELYVVDIKNMNSMIFRNLQEAKVENVSGLVGIPVEVTIEGNAFCWRSEDGKFERIDPMKMKYNVKTKEFEIMDEVNKK